LPGIVILFTAALLSRNHFLQKNIEGGQGIEADSSTGAESP
jgi:hypothetical protein